MSKNAMTFTSKKRDLVPVETGRHLMTIASITETVSASNGTPQLAVRFSAKDNSSQFITNWYNLLGYKRIPKEEFEALKAKDPNASPYARNKKGELIIDQERTAIARGIFENLACDAGIEEGKDFTFDDLIDKEVVVTVGLKDSGVKEVKRTDPVSVLDEVEEEMSE